MAFRDRLTDPTVHKWLAFQIEGIETVFVSDPTVADYFSGEYATAFNVRGGLKIPAQSLDRKAGAASPSTMTFNIGPDDDAGTLRTLFAQQNANAITAVLAETLDWDETTKVVVNDSSAFPNSGEITMGRETISYTNNDLAHNELENLTRGEHGSVAWKFDVDKDHPFGSQIVSNVSRVWRGREVKLWLGLSDGSGSGYPLDDAFEGENQSIVWRGRIEGLNLNEDWKSWSIACSSLDKALDTQVGGYQPQGRIAWTNSSWFNPGGSTVAPWGGVLLNGQNEVRIDIKAPGQTDWNDTVTATTAYGEYYTLVHYKIMEAMQTALNAAAGTGNIPGGAVFEVTENPSTQDSPYLPAYEKMTQIKIAVDDGVNTDWEFRLVVDEASALRMLGWTAGDWFADSTSDDGATKITNVFKQPGPAPYLYVSPLATQMLVYEEVGDTGTQFATGAVTGYAKLRYGDDTQEIIRYTQVDERWNDTGVRVLMLSGITRGYCDTQAQEVYIEGEQVDEATDSYAATADPPSIAGCIAFENTGLLSMFLQLALGTGGNVPRHATYDTSAIPEFAAAGMNADWFDIDTFEQADEELSGLVGLRNMAWSKPFNLRKWIADELAAVGYVLLSKPVGDNYQISLEPIREPAIVGYRSLDSASIILDPWPGFEGSLTSQANSIEMQLDWDVAAEEFGKHTVIVNDKRSQVDHGTTQPLKVQIKGVAKSKEQQAQVAISLGSKLLAHYADPYEILTIAAIKATWAWTVGDTVLVTIDGLPAPDGSLGWVDEPCLLVAMSPALVATGSKAANVLTLLHASGLRHSYYVPTAEITGFDAGLKLIALSENVYTESYQVNPLTGDDAVDADWFNTDDRITIRRPGEEATYSQDNVITSQTMLIRQLSGALPAWIAVGDVVVWSDYNTAGIQAAQKKHVYIADNLALLGTGNDDPFNYGA